MIGTLHTEAEKNRLAEKLYKQLETLLKIRATSLKKQQNTPDTQLKRDTSFLFNYFKAFIEERNNRADEIESPTVQSAARIALSLFPYATFGVFCVDGRIMQSVVFGFTAGFGRFLRLPAGDLGGFRIKENGELLLSPESEIAKLIRAHYEHYGNPLCQVFDSHLGCAARGLSEKNKGLDPKDGGLLEDVKRKKKIANALNEYVQKHHKKSVFVPIQMSFDPHNGYSFMALETEDSLKFAKDNGYVKTVLDTLTSKGTLISTQDLAKTYETTFKKYSFVISWEKEYADSAYQFWNALRKMISDETILTELEKKVKSIYKSATKDEVTQRALLLLANAFNGYLQNLKGYPLHTHTETCVIVQPQGFGPYTNASFSVYPSTRLAEHTIFASTIVRSNRANKNITDFTNTYKEDFVTAPVPVIIKSVVRTEYSPEVWRLIRNMDWSKLPDNWYDMTLEEFGDWVDDQYEGNIPRVFARAINDVRKMAAELYVKDEDTHLLLSEGKLALMPVIVDPHRRIQCIIPFSYRGLKK